MNPHADSVQQPSELAQYSRAMIAGQTHVCIAIEKRHGLFGWPPDIVSIALKAIDEGGDPDQAIDDYLNESGEDHDA